MRRRYDPRVQTLALSLDEPPAASSAWTLAAIPDSQCYHRGHLEGFFAQTRWIAAQRERLDIRFAAHLGDVVDDNSAAQWDAARRAMSALDGVVPYGFALGNHDYGEGGSADSRETGLHEAFDVEALAAQPTFGGAFESARADNTFHVLEAGGEGWIVLLLEFAPRDPVVAWAHETLAAHADRHAIVVTHAYLWSDGTRYDAASRADQLWAPHTYGLARLPGGANDGESLWRKLISRHANVRLVLCGHAMGEGSARHSSPGAGGATVHEILSNYQMLTRGGRGFLRLFRFTARPPSVQVETYSPLLRARRAERHQRFTLSW